MNQSDRHTIPPRLANRLLRWFLKTELAEEVVGDLEEQFFTKLGSETPLRAKLDYWFQVMNYLRPFAIRNLPFSQLKPFFMFRHNLKISYRTLVRDRGYTFLNIGGLALGMTVAFLIGLWVWDEITYNQYHENYEHIAQLKRTGKSNDGEAFVSSSHVSALGHLLRNDFQNHFEHIVMMRQTEERIVSVGNKYFSELGNFMQPEAPEMFTLDMVYGDRKGLYDLNTIFISESLSEKLFNDANPLGEIISINSAVDLKVTGVFKNLPRNSQFWETQFIAPLKVYFSITGLDPNVWENSNMKIYAQIPEGREFSEVSSVIKNELKNNIEPEKAKKIAPELFLKPMNEWHLYDEFEDGKYVTSTRLRFVWFYSMIGVFVLFLACINFMNLSTARSEKRAKEIGVRKTIGSRRGQLVGQFFSESILVALVSLTIAILVVSFMLPWFNGLAGKEIKLPVYDFNFWLVAVLFAFVTGLLAGIYPALYLSSFNPIKSLKGVFRAGPYSEIPRRALVVFQFTVSIALIIGTLMVHEQIQHAKDRPVGYSQDGLLMVPKRVAELYGKHEVFREELMKTGAVIEIAQANYPLTTTRGNNDGFSWPGKDPSATDPVFNTVKVNAEYGKTVGLEIIEGRDFSRDMATDKTGVIISESAQKIIGLEGSVGSTLEFSKDYFGANEFTILGVVKDMVKESPFESAMPTLMFLSEQDLPWMFIRLDPEIGAQKSLAEMENVFKKIAPNVPFEYKFTDEEYAAKFRSEERVGELATFFSVLAVLISCLGLFGLAAFVAERRTKEIGIRKVLGASVPQLWHLLSREFIALVFVACMVAIPIAYYFLNGWLQDFEYHTEMNWWVFATAGFGALVITFFTVSFQAGKAALANPVEALRSE